ncbi:D-alanyl-D-alanine carboxypeptidase family protein [Streptomyces sp. NRRL B-24085]|uniref:D-alanyl-D-alanine carboxypeptidase family protein n=1 Tax=Streptomyces sp. NRRL B-24085 TaxID=1709476 RepID=UPI000A644873|nr:serine hydrolase [Streptomyces sp. NRRL B-24085]
MALIIVAVLGIVFRLTSGDGGPGAGSATARAVNSAARTLPWPQEGQTSVLVEGLGDRGDLGTKGAQTPVPIASLTKVMTAYVILRGHPLRRGETGPDITVDQQADGESVSGVESSVPVRAGQRLSERRLLELMLIPSGNNIARLLARWDAGSQEAFATKMNQAAHVLGMHRTTYTSASGLESTTISTSADQLKLAQQVMRDEVIRSIVAMPSTTAPGTSGRISNTNALLGTSGVIGLKTGSSTPAGGNLMWAATAPDGSGQDRLILGVVLHQQAGTSPQQGLQAAFTSSATLIEGVRQWLAQTEPGTR